MTDETVENGRRRFLVVATSAMGGVAAAATAVPFVMSMSPSERAKAAGAPVEVDVSKLEPGMKLDVEWRGKVVWVLRRTPEMLAAVKSTEGLLADPASASRQQPDYARNEYRSIKPELLVVVGICTHLGCSPSFRKEITADWPGGFYCPCHGSKFDLAGRVFKGVPAPTNLEVPPYKYLSDGKIVIGEDAKSA